MARHELRHFTSREIKITQEQAAGVLKFFFPDQPVNPGSITPDDASFAQAC